MSTHASEWATSPPTESPFVAATRPRYTIVGVALMAVFAIGFGLLALRADPATPVLAVARPVPAGATITDADLTVVRIVPDPAAPVVAETDRATVVGKTAAVPLAEGSLLSPAQVGAPDWPPAGSSVIAVAVPGGRLPAGLVTGSRVSLLPPADPTLGSATTAPVAASVVQVSARDVSGSTVVSLLLATADAHRVAAAAEGLTLVLESPARGR